MPKPRDFLDVLSVLHALMRELRAKSRSEVEAHFDNPKESEIFKAFPKLLANADLVTFICDYCRLIIIGNAKTHEIEALMDEEIETLAHDKYKPVHAYQAIADGLPALGIVAAVLGVIHAMGALDQSPEVLGGLIGAALVGTFGGIFLSYGVVAPIAAKIKVVRHKQLRLYTLVKQSLLAFMNGAMPQVAVEFGRKTIPSKERPTIDTVENETSLGGGAGQGSGLTDARARHKSATRGSLAARRPRGQRRRSRSKRCRSSPPRSERFAESVGAALEDICGPGAGAALERMAATTTFELFGAIAGLSGGGDAQRSARTRGS